ncbi:glycogen/starch/alpha-glucan phosphorylase [Magnetofaba australis]|uniref:Alpha-1,4 glucan phosphorylase n=1 Tax=Magnetofaba australis IT-1 TaxID=1434232 RepID=A0A1Y2K963_9PROT|nr:glycogen/starch/alpha-glucan phosphorylase [Magnetofaba australis]OSM07282.1 putative glycogen/starch/alpha-glucan phosphorylase [Magnetofaba australis IT-1]
MSQQNNLDHPKLDLHSRTGTNADTLQRAILDNLFYIQGRFPDVATPHDWYQAVAYTVRDRQLHRWVKTAQTYKKQKSRSVCYLSAEFLIGPMLGSNLVNLGIEDEVREALSALGQDLDVLLEQEPEPGLGNGGLGRLAACYMDSLATLEIPAIGYGIRYEFGIFHQRIENGWQKEISDQWLHLGNPWEVPRPLLTFRVNLGGHTEHYTDDHGNHRVRWEPERVVLGVAHDTPIIGYGVNNTNLLRLWKAEAEQSFDFEAFNTGDYYAAVEEKVKSETISKVLYPNDEAISGKTLRLEQQYFFVSCSLRDMIRIHLQQEPDLSNFHEKFAAQLNDTHPAIAVAELMRLLVDEHHMDWNPAWSVASRTFSYTNHTLLPEALETWSLPLLQQVLPRHVEIIYEINMRFMDQVRVLTHDVCGAVTRLSIIEEGEPKRVRMANLACVGSHAINGVAALHTELLKKTTLNDFHNLWPEKFLNVTNGVTPRRFLLLSNPKQSKLISDRIGEGWITDLEKLRGLEAHLDDAGFREDWRRVKRENKEALAKLLKERTYVDVDPQSLFSVQAKRIHEYKRQHLHLLYVVTLYNRIINNPNLSMAPRVHILGGKAAPGYAMAKLFIKLAHAVGEMVNRDQMVGDRLKLVFFPNFNVKNAQRIYPAADLSEQISTAGFEASGTGNMKFSMNGALTIGTLDGANVEIREVVGDENFFLFGMTAEEVVHLKTNGYHPRHYYDGNAELRAAMDLIASGYFSHGEADVFKPLIDNLLEHDPFMVLADYEAYCHAQSQVDDLWAQPDLWTRKSILNVARIGKFSSDRAIREYCEKIWKVQPTPVD